MSVPPVNPVVAGTPEPVLVSIHDIHVSTHWLLTPIGNRPLAGTQLYFVDATTRRQVIPTWAIVLAIVGALFFLLGLLFLLVRETRVTGYFTVTAVNGDFAYTASIPGSLGYAVQFADVQNRINHARAIIAGASS